MSRRTNIGAGRIDNGLISVDFADNLLVPLDFALVVAERDLGYLSLGNISPAVEKLH